MNDYIQSPDGQRMRFIRPTHVQPPGQIVGGRLRAIGVAHIDQWMPAEAGNIIPAPYKSSPV